MPTPRTKWSRLSLLCLFQLARCAQSRAYAGFTVSELRGLKWSDYDFPGGLLYVRRGVWKSTVGETKTATRRKPVPVIARLRSLLDAYAASVLPRRPDQWIFTSSVETPIDLGNLVNRVIRPTLTKPGLTWRGYHALRRGLATTLYSLNVPELVVQRILRHKPGSASNDLKNADDQHGLTLSLLMLALVAKKHDDSRIDP
jgi:integrase